MRKFPCGRMEMATTNPVIIDQNGKVIRRSNHIIVSILVLISLEIASHASVLLFRSFKSEHKLTKSGFFSFTFLLEEVMIVSVF